MNVGDHHSGDLRAGDDTAILAIVGSLNTAIEEEGDMSVLLGLGDAPEVDGCVCVSSEEPLYSGQFYDVLVEDSDLYDLYGTVVK